MGVLPDGVPCVEQKKVDVLKTSALPTLSIGRLIKGVVMEIFIRRKRETKEERVARKQRESIPLEAKERKLQGIPERYRSVERMIEYDQPIDKAALNIITPDKVIA